jgi:sugar lactone lactonase YvrE
MADGAFVPLGVDEAGKLAYAIYTDGQGRFKVTLPPKPAGNLLVVASPAGAQDPRLAVDLISPGGGAVQLDDGSTAVAGYLRRVMVARAADLLGIASCRPLPDQESALVKGLREALAAFAPTFQAAGFAALSPPAQQRVLLRFADAVLAGQPLAEVQAAPQLLTSKTSKAQGPAVALLTDRFKALEAAAAKRLEADAGFFDRQPYMAIANRQVAGRAPYAIRKPADLTEFIVERYLTDNADDAYEWMEPIFQDCGLDPHDSVDVAAAGLGILARQAEVVKGEGEVASLQATIQKACAEEAAAGLAGAAAPCAASPAPGGPAYDVQTLAGTGEPGSQDGDGAQATFREPRSLAYDPAGWLYVCDGNALIRRIDLNGKDHAVNLVAGGQPGFQDGEGATARFNAPRGLTLSPDGALYVADVANQRLRKVDLADRAHVVVTTVAGDGTHGWADGPAATARFADAQGLALGPDGSLYVADTANHRIRKLAPDGAVTTVAGSDANGTQPGIGAEAGFKAPVGVALAPDGYLYVLDAMASIVQRVGLDGSVAHYAGSQGWPAAADGSFYGAGLSFPAALALGPDGALFVADVGNQRIRRLDPDGRITTIAGSGPTGYGNGGFADGPAASSRFADPAGIAVGKDGTVYVADTANNRIRMLVPR